MTNKGILVGTKQPALQVSSSFQTFPGKFDVVGTHFMLWAQSMPMQNCTFSPLESISFVDDTTKA